MCFHASLSSFATRRGDAFVYDCNHVVFLRDGAKHDYNAYFNSGGGLGEAHSVTSDPLFVGPLLDGVQSSGLEACKAFRLDPGSPLTGAGIPVPGAPATNFYGKPAAGANIGAD